MGQEERAGGCEQLGERRRTRPGVSASSRQGMEAAAVVTAQTRAGFSRVIKLENAAPAHKESTGFLADPQHQQLQHRPHSTDPHCA